MSTSTLTENGVSTTKGLGEEKFTQCCLGAFRGQVYFQYDYRHTDGELFSIVQPTLERCREEQDKWVLWKSLYTSKRQEIRQDGKTLLHSNDGVSIPMIFRNLTGQNFQDLKEYQTYVQCVALRDMGFHLGEIEVVADGILICKGTIQETLQKNKKI